MNLNENYDKNFKLACELCDKNFSHEDLIEFLKNGNIVEKQYSALALDGIFNSEDGQVLVNNLTGCDGKIREAVALKINKLLMSDSVAAEFMNYPEIFADASIDINANICRLVIDSVSVLKQRDDFSKRYLSRIIYFIEETFGEIDKFIFKDKKYVINKQLFKLYWCLESLKLFVDDISDDVLGRILERASLEKEYTIREKVAQILVLKNCEKFSLLVNKLKHDENYYVKAAMQRNVQ